MGVGVGNKVHACLRGAPVGSRRIASRARVESLMTTLSPALGPAAKRDQPTPVGFEPTRGDPIGLAGRRLSHSAKVSYAQTTLNHVRASFGNAMRIMWWPPSTHDHRHHQHHHTHIATTTITTVSDTATMADSSAGCPDKSKMATRADSTQDHTAMGRTFCQLS